MPPAFSIVQRLELERDLALTPEQVHELEVTALPMITAFVRRQPTKIDVRDELRATAKALKGAQRAILRLLGGTSVSDRVSPRDAALTRVVVASYEMGADGDVLDSTLSTLTAAIHVIEGALADLPASATRRRTASYVPVGFIDKALMAGFLKKHGQWPGRGTKGRTTALPPYPIKPSYAEGSPYKRIVEICYTAAGAPEGSKERPIREFLRLRKSSRTVPPKST